jgi:prophage regulatory protein
MAQAPQLDPILRPKFAAEFLGVSRSTIYRLRSLGLLPEPARIGIAAIGWRQSVLADYVRRAEGGGRSNEAV